MDYEQKPLSGWLIYAGFYPWLVGFVNTLANESASLVYLVLVLSSWGL